MKKAPILRTIPTIQYVKLAITVLTGLIITGCGNIMKPNIPHASTSSYVLASSDATAGSTGASGSSTDPNYTCPSSPNVLPDYDYWHDGTAQYTVCMSRTDQTHLLIHGTTPQGNQICVFPAQVIDSQHIYTKPDLQTGFPMYSCSDLSSQGVYANFDGVNYNGVFIVMKTNVTQMQQCLWGGNYYGCPQYSFGRFR